jgi:ELWxxDGT repeat protein
MSKSLVLFNGIDANGLKSLWETDGTAAGTWEVSVPPVALDPVYITAFENEALFGYSLSVTDGTSAGTTEVSLAGNPEVTNLVAFGNKAFFGVTNLWVTDGTSAGTSELTVNGANTLDGLNPSRITPFGSEALFAGFDSSFHEGLWVTDGTSAGTSEVTVANAWSTGVLALGSSNFAILGSEALFRGADAFGQDGLWETDGTSNGTYEITTKAIPDELVTFGSEVLFADVFGGLWVTDGTSSGTTEIMTGVGAAPHDFTVFGNKVLFAAGGASSDNLWVTDGTAAGTSEITVAGAGPKGLFIQQTSPFFGNGPFSPGFAVLGSEALFEGQDANGGLGLWVTDGTSAGTSELVVAGALPTPPNTFPAGLSPTFLTTFTQNLLHPVLSNLPAASVSYTVRGTPVTLAPSVYPSDSNSLTLARATLSITGGTFPEDGDVLAASTSGTSIAANYSSATETLTLTGTDTLAHYKQVLDSVTFHSTNANLTNAGANRTRTVTWTVDDGSSANNLSAPATTTINLQSAAVPFDLNGDANSDLVFQNNGQAGVWLMNGTTPIAEAGLGNPGASWHVITSRDVNGDGNADLIWQNSDGTPGIWLMNGTTPIAEAGFSNPGASWHIKAAGDLNGDGNADLVWQGTDGTLGVWLMNGTTPGAEAAIGNPGANWKVIGTADYNGDGRDDILLQNTATGNLMIDLMKGTSIASTVSITVGDSSWHAVSTGEFNGQAEIAWQNSNGTPAIWLMNGTAPAAEAALPNPGAAWQVLSIDHFTGNGQADLLFQNTNGAIGMWEMNGTNIVAAVGLLNPGSGWQSVNGHPFTSG